jgi:fructose-bisphosphate aldolase class 1
MFHGVMIALISVSVAIATLADRCADCLLHHADFVGGVVALAGGSSLTATNRLNTSAPARDRTLRTATG